MNTLFQCCYEQADRRECHGGDGATLLDTRADKLNNGSNHNRGAEACYYTYDPEGHKYKKILM